MFGFVMIVIAIGSNLPHPAFGAPIDVCNAAIHAIEDSGCEVMERSRWFHSAPVPASDQPDFVNGVVSVRTALAPDALLTCLHRIEDRFDRLRSVPNAARTLDLDLIAYHNMVNSGEGRALLPHPRMSRRAFVLYPLRDIAPDWRHPSLGDTLQTLIDALPDGQVCHPVD
jgi:2-amino-4-hydroxy-6-hydroxymethyldihydropteridine diphosphokinase